METFKGKTKPMTGDGPMIFLSAVYGEKKKMPMPKGMKTEHWFLPNIIQARIKAMNLPIEITDYGYMALLALVDRPGAAVVALIDLLTKFEGKTIGTNEVAELYPFGFYTEESMIDYIDNYIKPGKIKWAEIY